MAAYNAKDYPTCADAFAQLATTLRPARRADMMYSAACCLALGGSVDRAFTALDDAIGLGFRDIANAEKDTDLVKLHGDARWPAFLDKVRAKVAEMEKALTKPELRRELLDLVAKDQAARFAVIDKQKAGGSGDWKSVEAIDKADTAAVHRIITADGWPGKAMVGEDGAHAAWLLVQHADLDRPLQKDVLARMKPMIATGEVSEVDYAYLDDRVAVAEHRPQRYGTQFDAHQQPQPIEDEGHLDERRKAIGMPSMAEYREMMRKMYGPPKN